ncbi:MAG: hypothetical protein ACKPKO_32135, partial [Candidatus Fonsibacter sp.]
NFTGSGNNSNILSTITDFTIAVDGNNQYRPMVVYNPSAEYRLIDMNSSMILHRIDSVLEGHLWQHPPVRAPSRMLSKCEAHVQKQRLVYKQLVVYFF